MKFLIFGSTGLLGSNLLKVINEKNYSVGVISLNSVIGYDLSLLDIGMKKNQLNPFGLQQVPWSLLTATTPKRYSQHKQLNPLISEQA